MGPAPRGGSPDEGLSGTLSQQKTLEFKVQRLVLSRQGALRN